MSDLFDQLLSRHAERRETVKHWKTRICDSLGRYGHFEIEDIEYLLCHPKVVKAVQRSYGFKETGIVEDLIRKLKKDRQFFIFGHSEINACTATKAIKYGHYDLVENTLGQSNRILIQILYVRHKVNERLDFLGFSPVEFESIFRTALHVDNQDVVKMLTTRPYSMDISESTASSIGYGGNVEYFERANFTKKQDLLQCASGAALRDHVEILERCLDRLQLKFRSKQIPALIDDTISSCSSRCLEMMLHRFPHINLVEDVFGKGNEDYSSDFDGVIASGDRRIVNIVLANMLKFA